MQLRAISLCCFSLLIVGCESNSPGQSTSPGESSGELAFRLSAPVSQRVSLDADSIRIRVQSRGRDVAVKTFPANVPGDLVVTQIPPAKGAVVAVEAFNAPNVVNWSGSTQIDIVGNTRTSASVKLAPLFGSLDLELTLDSVSFHDPVIEVPRFDTTQWGHTELPVVNLQVPRPTGTDSVVCALASGQRLRCDNTPLSLLASQTIYARSYSAGRLSDMVADSVTVGGDFSLSGKAGHPVGITVENARLVFLPATPPNGGWVGSLRFFESVSSANPVITIRAPDSASGLLLDSLENMRLQIGLGSRPMFRSYSVTLGYVGPSGIMEFTPKITDYYNGFNVALQDFQGGIRGGMDPIHIPVRRIDYIRIEVQKRTTFTPTSPADSFALEFTGLRFH